MSAYQIKNADFSALQVSKKAAKAKFSRLCGTSQTFCTIGFSSWFLMQEEGDWYIVAFSNYHCKNTLEQMYKTNNGSW